MNIIVILVVVVLAVAIVLKVSGNLHLPGKGRAGGRELYDKLLRKAFGDKAQVERLIEVERRKNPNASRVVWMRNANDRWERQNR